MKNVLHYIENIDTKPLLFEVRKAAEMFNDYESIWYHFLDIVLDTYVILIFNF